MSSVGEFLLFVVRITKSLSLSSACQLASNTYYIGGNDYAKK